MVISTITSPCTPLGSSDLGILRSGKIDGKAGFTSSPVARPSNDDPDVEPASEELATFSRSKSFERFRILVFCALFRGATGKDNSGCTCVTTWKSVGRNSVVETGVAVPPSPFATKEGLTKIGAAGQQRTSRTMPWTTTERTNEKPQPRLRRGCACVKVAHSCRSWSKERSMLLFY